MKALVMGGRNRNVLGIPPGKSPRRWSESLFSKPFTIIKGVYGREIFRHGIKMIASWEKRPRCAAGHHAPLFRSPITRRVAAMLSLKRGKVVLELDLTTGQPATPLMPPNMRGSIQLYSDSRCGADRSIIRVLICSRSINNDSAPSGGA